MNQAHYNKPPTSHSHSQSHKCRSDFTSLKDTIRPKIKGSSILARNLGRHIHNLFWEKSWIVAKREIFSNRMNCIHSRIEILLVGKAVGNHGCNGSDSLHLTRTSVEAPALSQLLDLQINLIDANFQDYLFYL